MSRGRGLENLAAVGSLLLWSVPLLLILLARLARTRTPDEP